MYKDDKIADWGCGLAVLYLLGSVVVAIGWYAVGGLSAIIILYFSYFAITGYREALREKKRSCNHGVEGAFNMPDRCSWCVEERALRLQAEAEAQQKDAERRRLAIKAEEIERTAKHQAWLRQIRLPEYLASMDPYVFEALVAQLFEKQGYRVELTSKSGDSGVDAYLWRNGELTILQCKRVKGSVGEPVLRDLFGTMHDKGAKRGLVVTTGRVSKQAQKWVNGKPIALIDLSELTALIRQTFPESEVVPTSFSVPGNGTNVCPECNSPLRKLKGRYGWFWGCTRYPGCQFTRNAGRAKRS